jgi:hypothetical protein
MSNPHGCETVIHQKTVGHGLKDKGPRFTREQWAERLRAWGAEADEFDGYVRLSAEQARAVAWLLHAVGPSQTLQCGLSMRPKLHR